MTTDYRALCVELLDALESNHQTWRIPVSPLVARARAFLAEPVADGLAAPEGREPASVVGEPSDEEIMGLMPQQMHEDLAAVVRAMAEQEGISSTPAKGVMRIILNRHVVDLARAVLARYGHQPAPPAEGEVAELTRWLRMQGEAQKPGPNSLLSDRTKKEHHAAGVKLTRAAHLLEQRHPEPVPPAGSGKSSATGREVLGVRPASPPPTENHGTC